MNLCSRGVGSLFVYNTEEVLLDMVGPLDIYSAEIVLKQVRIIEGGPISYTWGYSSYTGQLVLFHPTSRHSNTILNPGSGAQRS